MEHIALWEETPMAGPSGLSTAPTTTPTLLEPGPSNAYC
jgi:hypothetical protein